MDEQDEILEDIIRFANRVVTRGDHTMSPRCFVTALGLSIFAMATILSILITIGTDIVMSNSQTETWEIGRATYVATVVILAVIAVALYKRKGGLRARTK